MNPVTELLLVLSGIYILSCFVLVRPGQVVIARSLFTGWVLRTARSLWGNRLGSVFFEDPFPVLSAVILSPFPISISPDGVYGRSPEDYAVGQNRPLARFVRFDEIAEVAVDGSELHINGSRFIRACAPAAAVRLKDCIERLMFSPDQRENLIRDFVRDTLRFAAARQEMGAARQKMSFLHLLCWVLCFELFAGLPYAGYWLGPDALLWCFAVLVLTNLATLLAFSKVYSSCIGKPPAFSELVMMFVCFPKTARSFDLVKEELTTNYHPLVFAAAMDKAVFRDMARLALADLMFSSRDRHSTEEYFRNTYRDVLLEQVHSLGVQPEWLLAQPLQETPDTVAYCPLCGSQYSRTGFCSDCVEIPLQTFTSGQVIDPDDESWPEPIPFRTLRRGYLFFALTLIPLLFSLLFPRNPNDVNVRLSRSLAQLPLREQTRIQRMMLKPETSIDQVVMALPEHRIESALLTRDSWIHWVYAAASAAVFLAFLCLIFPGTPARHQDLVLTGLFTGTIGILLLLAFQYAARATQSIWLNGASIVTVFFYIVKFIGFSYSAALDPRNGFLLSCLGFTCGVGFCEEICKMLPLIWQVRRQPIVDWRAACLWGLASGVGFGVSEGITYAANYYNGIETAGIYTVRFISCVALHSMWSGAVAITLFERQHLLKSKINGSAGMLEFLLHLLTIVAIPMVLHGLYDTLLKKDANTLAFIIALASFVWLVFQVEKNTPKPAVVTPV